MARLFAAGRGSVWLVAAWQAALGWAPRRTTRRCVVWLGYARQASHASASHDKAQFGWASQGSAGWATYGPATHRPAALGKPSHPAAGTRASGATSTGPPWLFKDHHDQVPRRQTPRTPPARCAAMAMHRMRARCHDRLLGSERPRLERQGQDWRTALHVMLPETRRREFLRAVI